MKKYLAMLLAVMMLVGLVACGPPAPPTPTDAPTVTTTGTEAPPETTEPFVSKDPNYGTIIIGSTTEISGDWGRAMWTNNATDAMIRELIDGYGTVMSDREALFDANPTVVEKLEMEVVEHPEVEAEDGENTSTKIFKITIKKDLTYNNGDPITAKDFVAQTLFGCSKEGTTELATKLNSYMSIVGGAAYQKGEADFVSGIRLYDDYTFSFEIVADKLPYFYDITYAGASPMHYKLWFGEDVDIVDEGEGCSFNEAFTLEKIQPHVDKQRYLSDNRVSAGPYTLQSYDDSAKQAILVANDLFAGNLYGEKPEVEKIVIIKAEDATWADGMKTGIFNVYDKVTGGDDVTAAMDIIEEMGMDFAQYDRAGYGLLNFACDMGPTQFVEVRHAVAYLLDRPEFAETYCKGWGGLVHGPYGVAHWMYQESEEWLEDNLNKYPSSLDSAVAELEAGGWTLDENGETFKGEGLRYKEVTEEQAGSYEYVKTVGDKKLMALEIEWLSTEGNDVSELLKVMLSENENTAKAGMQINQTVVDFTQLLNWYYRDATEGDQYGVPKYGMFNLATNFTPVYDFAYNFTLDEDLLALGYDTTFLRNAEMDKLSMDMVYGVEAGDDAAFLEVWRKFIKLWNELLPQVPLYSNTYITVIPDWLADFEMTPFWGFQDAIVGATVRK